LYQAEQRGIKKGKEEGKEEGKKEGKEEGKEEERISIAKNMLKLNFPLDAISQVTGLTASEIEKLK
jgi:predicted transposase/invertase (TIGR01784 family)